MRHSAISACYYPTTVLFVDDSRSYLTNISTELDVSKFSFNLFFDPSKALEFLKSYELNLFTQRCIERPEEDGFDHRNIDIDISKIWHEIYNPQRFSELSVIVVDYAMPGLNGLEFCRQCRLLKNSPFKIIMLTGEADEEMAIKLFNDKIIDKFVRKNVANFADMLNAGIIELQKEYFSDLSTIVIDSLTKDPDHPTITWLDEPAFMKLFDDICQKHAVTEYYLTDAFGSFMFLDIEGKPSWLVVKSDEEMQAAYEVAEGSAGKVPKGMLEAMLAREKILYLQHGGLSDNPKELEQSIHPTTRLVGNKSTYYYSFVENPAAYDIDSKEILSYQAYRDQWGQA